MPSSRQARRIRSAISPRLAMTIFSIMSGLFEDEQWLAEFDRVAVLRHDRGDAPGPIGFDLVHHLHRLDDAQHLPDLDLIADLDEGLGSRGGRGVEGPPIGAVTTCSLGFGAALPAAGSADGVAGAPPALPAAADGDPGPTTCVS